MIMSRLTTLALAALLSTGAFAATATSGTGPTDPVEKPKAPALQTAPGLNTDGSGVDSSMPPATGTDPRLKGNDTGRQGGAGMPETGASDNAGTGTSSKTTTGGSGSEGAGK
ncbi:hypothetical protein C9I50_04990 [Pseudomonas prosekii]|uniref:Serine protease n=1 Tax=Pseudomonas prosekii TaxID=1148509 RepID=A0A1H2AG16_9PSED|nr:MULTISPECIES: hypothetical protein [Pseudomonas]PKH12475.1 hypothetical protein BI292_22995 [Pseudomonas sp. 43NM1]PWE44659.1 hypothetical protein C9I50_04990 [Pseudomonas prosekii]PWE47386.1 hypothetical protein C9I49_02500 [Pseudomonas prosekii]SDT44918.1 hypothetical protein SAMN05216222_4446 [Pseudomonas prosekii]